MRTEDNENIFATSDLALAAALLSLGFELVSLDRGNARRVGFVFVRENYIENDVEAFWNSKLRVEPKEYFDAIKNLKNRLYSGV